MTTNNQPSEINHGDQLNPSNSILILLIRPSATEATAHPPQPDQTIRIHSLKTRVQDIKNFVFEHWAGKPNTAGIRLIARGRILNNSEIVGEALGKPPDDLSAHAIHVVVRPNAWSEKLSSPSCRSVSAPVTPYNSGAASSSTLPPSSSVLPKRSSTQVPPNSTNPLENLPGSSSHLTSASAPNASTHQPASSAQLFINHFSSLTAFGKGNFVQNILQARFKIVERVDHLRRQIHDNHLLALGLTNAPKKSTLDPEQMAQHEQEWKVVQEKIVKLLKDLNAWNYHPESTELVDLDSSIESDVLDQSASEFKRVEIAGLPYLLYIPESASHETASSKSDSHLKVYKTLQKELNRTLHIEAQVDVLILQAQKIQAGLNSLDYVISASGIHQTTGYTQRFQTTIQHPLGVPAGLPHFPPVPGNAPAPGLGFGFGVGADGLHPPNNFLLPNGAMWQHPVARVRRYEFTINLDSIRRYLAPLLWLSLKLSVLLYVFGRHASSSKLVILVMIALGWVLWEAFSISQRHGAQARRRERLQRGQQAPGVGAAGGGPAVDPIQAVLDRGRRRAERERLHQLIREQHQRADGLLGVENQDPVAPPNNNLQPPAPAPAPAQPAEPAAAAPAPALNPNPVPGRNPVRGLRAAAAYIRARGGAFPPGTEVRPFRNTSALSPKYWFNSIAVVGLASEYRELGLHSIGERAMGASNLEYPKWYRYLRNTKTCLVLFFGTLLPEIEKKRRKALEKRARILNLVIADAARDTNHARARNQDLPRVETQAGDNNSAHPPQPVTSTPRPAPRSSSETSESSSSRAIKSNEDNDNQLTPRATRATALERIPSGSINERLSLRRSRLVSEPKESSHSIYPTMSTEESNPMDKSKVVVEETSNSTASESTSSPVENEVTSSSTSNNLVTPSTSAHQEAIVQHDTGNNNNNLLASPLTPLEPTQVVGGLDDTDDEEIMGNDNEEPGMLLF